MILEDILRRAGVEVRVGHKTGEVRICCPFCPENGETGDTRFRLGVNVLSGMAHDYNCGWRSGSFRRTVRELCRIYGLKFNLHEMIVGGEERVAERFKETPPRIVGYPDGYEAFSGTNEKDPIEDKAWRYLRRRKVSRTQILKHKIGYAAGGSMSWRILFPVFGEDGEVYGACGRDFSAHGKPKYLNTPGTKLLWNGHRVNRSVVLTEGIFDALRVERALIEGAVPGTVVAARLGSAITAHQLEQLAQFDKVIYLPDWDVAGVNGALELGPKCQYKGIALSVAVPARMTGVDPGSMSTEEILSLLRAAQPWHKVVEFKLRAAAMKEEVA